MLWYRRYISLIRPLIFFEKNTSVDLNQNILCISKRFSLSSKQTAALNGGINSKTKRKDDRRKERKEIIEDIQKGYFADYHEFRKTGGKRYFALEKPFQEKDAEVFPSIQGKNLKHKVVDLHQEFPNHVTLVMMWFRAIGQSMCDKYRLPFMQHFQDHPLIQYYEVNVVDGLLFRLLRPFIESSLRKSKSEDRHDNYLCHFGNASLIKKQLIENVIVGHVFLVDSNGCIRWRAHANPTPEELKYLLQCTDVLLKDLHKKLHKK